MSCASCDQQRGEERVHRDRRRRTAAREEFDVLATATGSWRRRPDARAEEIRLHRCAYSVALTGAGDAACAAMRTTAPESHGASEAIAGDEVVLHRRAHLGGQAVEERELAGDVVVGKRRLRVRRSLRLCAPRPRTPRAGRDPADHADGCRASDVHPDIAASMQNFSHSAADVRGDITMHMRAVARVERPAAAASPPETRRRRAAPSCPWAMTPGARIVAAMYAMPPSTRAPRPSAAEDVGRVDAVLERDDHAAPGASSGDSCPAVASTSHKLDADHRDVARRRWPRGRR